MKIFYNRQVLLVLLMLIPAFVQGQQLKLGANPTTIEKSALLDLNSDKQGLLLPRVTSYTVAPLSTAPDGMLIYYVPDKLLYIRKNGTWKKLVDETTAISSVNGQTGPAVSLTTDNIAEGTTNLYYTNARARGAFSAGTGIGISAAGVISALNTSNIWNAAQLQGRNIAATAPTDQYILTWDAASSTWMPKLNPATNNWLITGNSGIDANNQFLGTIDDKKMVIRSNNQSLLEFGRRATLGLVDGYTDYTDGDEKVTYMRSALQFEVPASVSFYKPKFWTTTDGNFRLKGSSAGTDYFELGATGSNNNGGFEFIIGDDGDEPILFKSYYYGDQTTTEIMRLQRKKVGINVAGVEPAQTLDVRGTMRLTGSTGTPDAIIGRNSTSGDVANVALDATTLSMTTGTVKANNTSAVWNANQLRGVAISTTTPTSGQYLVYNGTAWTPTTASGGSGGGSNWSTTGNSGTTAGTNFIGTTDNTALVVKTNNAEAVRVDAAGKVGVKNTAPTSTLHVGGSVATGMANYYNPGTATTVNLDDTYYTIARKSDDYNYVAAVTANLPAASSCPGRIYVFSNTITGSGSGKVYVVPKTGDSIGKLGNNATMTLDESIAATIQSTGTYWIVIYKGSNQGY